ncbi:MAG TPA: hypothetical protein VIG57_16845, partial [Candidatus Entotheonella sp.]
YSSDAANAIENEMIYPARVSIRRPGEIQYDVPPPVRGKRSPLKVMKWQNPNWNSSRVVQELLMRHCI